MNVVSVGALAAVPVPPAYSASKAASFSLTQSPRELMAERSVEVHAVLPGPIDTDMVRDLPIPKTSPESDGAQRPSPIRSEDAQLLIYHFMFGPEYTAGCPSCSAIADGMDGSVVHLANHDLTLCAVSRDRVDPVFT